MSESKVGGCLIWDGHEGNIYWVNPNRDHAVDSLRAGGKYIITEEAALRIRNGGLDDSQKARLTTMLVDQRRLGIEEPLVTASLVGEAKKAQSLSVPERADRLLRFIADQAVPVSTWVLVTEETPGAYAWSESIQPSELDYFLVYLMQNEWIRSRSAGSAALECVVTVEGYRQIEEQKANDDSSQAFVAMWFDDSMEGVFENGIKPAVKAAGYEPLRVDRKPTLGKIDDQIIAEIRQSRFLVADFTHGDDGARGSVYFEAGFAHGLRKPVIYTCRRDMVDRLHFDTRQYPHIVWATPEELCEQLQSRIRALLDVGPKWEEGASWPAAGGEG